MAIHHDFDVSFTSTWGQRVDVSRYINLMYRDTPIHGDTSKMMYHPGSVGIFLRKPNTVEEQLRAREGLVL